MPLWVAAVLFLLCAIETVLAFRSYFRGRGKIFLVYGIALSLVCVAAILYALCVLILVSAVN